MNDPSFEVRLLDETVPFQSVSDALLGYLALADTAAAASRPGVLPEKGGANMRTDVVVAVQCGQQLFGFTHRDVLAITARFKLPQPVGEYGNTRSLIDLAILEFVWQVMLKTVQRQRGVSFVVATSDVEH